MVIWIATAAAAVLTILAEGLHLARTGRVRRLVFGPSQRPAHWTAAVPILRAAAAGLLTWGLLILMLEVEPKVHRAEEVGEGEDRHLVLVLDVSPSMRLEDAGPSHNQSRLHRSRDVLNSMFNRVPMGRYKVTVVATYNGAMPVVIDTTDAEVVRNVLTDLPMHHAFEAGETRLFDGLEEAARIAKPWRPKSTTVVVVSDGDTLPPTGMPQLPGSVTGVLVVGVGDPLTGKFINGRHSRQNVSTLRQMALRLGGTYHDGNKRQVATSVLVDITGGSGSSPLEQLTLREYALLAVGLGAALLGLLPLLLHWAGTRWQPGRWLEPRRNTLLDGVQRVPSREVDDRLAGRRA